MRRNFGRAQCCKKSARGSSPFRSALFCVNTTWYGSVGVTVGAFVALLLLSEYVSWERTSARCKDDDKKALK